MCGSRAQCSSHRCLQLSQVSMPPCTGYSVNCRFCWLQHNSSNSSSWQLHLQATICITAVCCKFCSSCSVKSMQSISHDLFCSRFQSESLSKHPLMLCPWRQKQQLLSPSISVFVSCLSLLQKLYHADRSMIQLPVSPSVHAAILCWHTWQLEQ